MEGLLEEHGHFNVVDEFDIAGHHYPIELDGACGEKGPVHGEGSAPLPSVPPTGAITRTSVPSLARARSGLVMLATSARASGDHAHLAPVDGAGHIGDLGESRRAVTFFAGEPLGARRPSPMQPRRKV